MKHINFFLMVMLCISLGSCKEKYAFGDMTAPSNLQISYEIVGQDGNNPSGDGTGLVNFTIKANNALSYRIDFGDNKNTMAPSGKYQYRYTKVGNNKYTVVFSAVGAGGVMTSETREIEVFSSFSDAEAENLLAGKNIGDSKTWYWAANVAGFAGLGPQESGNFSYADWWSATPFDATRTCMYENSFVFSRTNSGITYKQTLPNAFVPGAYASVLGVEGDTCHDASVIPSVVGEKLVSLLPSSSKAALEGTYNNQPYRKTAIELSDNGMLGWWVGASTYDIISLTETQLIVRIMQPNSDYAWYHIFTTTKPSADSFTNLVWQDEFNTDGTLDTTKWTYDLGRGNNGWGNSELQTYTDNPENVRIENGSLKITAKADGSGSYTSARVKTQGLYSFKYGKVEIKAKLPKTQGTWPALWLLGDTFATEGWPKCGEIDILEQKGNDKANILGALHWLDSATNKQGDFAQESPLDKADDFHIYTMTWTAEKIIFAVDGKNYFEMANNANLPFNQKFFLIFNQAIGGNLGGAVDPNFTQDTFEIDYVRVYQ